MFYKKAILKNIHRKATVLESLLNKVAGFQACNFIKKILQHRCFPVNIVKFFKKTYFEKHPLAVFILRRTNRLRRLVRLKKFSVRQYKYGTKSLVDGIFLSFHRLILCDKTMLKLEKLCRQD